ncbi:MAG: magnesium-translocating P-type ATPase [Acidobacteria bacterium]|nr:magnesium-translocating P-type ATPase [Acidobacteriota bacterium]
MTAGLRTTGLFARSGNRKSNLTAGLSIDKAAAAPIDEVLTKLETTPAGLSEREAELRLARYGENEIAHEKPPHWSLQLLLAFKNTFIFLLALLALVSYLTDDLRAAIVISLMVLISGLLRFGQEYRSKQAAEKLKAMVQMTATVTRRRVSAGGFETIGHPPASNGHPREEIVLQKLVPGDIVHLAAGDMIPADVRLLASKELFISQAALTGESLPVEKLSEASLPGQAAGMMKKAGLLTLFEKPNIALMGTNVVSGTAIAVVVATGQNTQFGSIALNVLGKRVLTNFDRGVNSVSWLLIRFVLVMAPLVFVINGLSKGDWREAFFFAVAVAVGLTPEMLPMIVTANLARGAVEMSRRKVIIKNLNAIQNLGAMDVLCTDKTGTLTMDKVVLEKHLDINGATCDEVLLYGYLNSFYQTGLKNLLDIAVLEHAGLKHRLDLDKNYRQIDEIPFDFIRRRMSVVVERGRTDRTLICKGAVEETLAICSRAKLNGETTALSETLRNRAKEMTRRLNEEGFRVIAVAIKSVEKEDYPYSVGNETAMTLIGFFAFLDPPRDSAAEAIETLNARGVEVKVLTGDNEIVAQKICREVGLNVKAVALGSDLEEQNDAELEETAVRTTVFAKLSPVQKSRVIQALKRRGHTVGFLGDGINDAPALREADVGVSVDTAVDIAKESASVILLEKSLLVLERGIITGRRTFANTVKYIKMGASSNFGNVFSVLGASAILPFLPMIPLQLLVQNLLYDLSQTAIPFDRVDDEYLKMPRKWEVSDIGRFMLFIGPISSIFDYTTFALMWFVFSANTEGRQSLFQTGWFIEGLLSQTLIVHMIRTEKIPFVQSTASLPLMLLTISIMLVGMYVPFSPFAQDLGMERLPPIYFAYLLATLFAYCCLTQLVKVFYIRKFGKWL